MPTIWEVVGGIDKGGILAREGESLASAQLPERLPTGTLVEELRVAGERLHFRNSSGRGPAEGWVSTRLGPKVLLQPQSKVDEANGLEGALLPADLGLQDLGVVPDGHPNVYALSDLHTDHPGNMRLFKELPSRPHDVVILAGDISHNLQQVEDTFKLFLARFGHVFFCPGNHDLWLHSKDGCKDSLEKLHKLLGLCKKLGVHTQPKAVGHGILIVPLLSWYEPGFDPDPDVRDDSLAPVEKTMSDFSLCKWPQLSASDSSVSHRLDELNAQLPDTGEFSTVISFSHFLPRHELVPEKRYLAYPHLPKAVGSRPLGERVRRLAPTCHIFGHTHYGWDVELDGIRYLQAAVAYPGERDSRGFALELLESRAPSPSPGPDDSPAGGVTEPILVFDAEKQAFPRYHGFWSSYYGKYPRRPDDVRWLYRKPREKTQVYKPLRQLVTSGAMVTDEAIAELITAAESS